MPKFGISGYIPQQCREGVYEAETFAEAVAQYKAEHPEARIEVINGHSIWAFDEGTGEPIAEGDFYGSDPDDCCYELIERRVDLSVPAEGYEFDDEAEEEQEESE